MSLPQAKKEISDHPSAGTVTEPINRQKLQTDVDRKLRLYGVFAAIQQSRLPTNDQLDALLSRLSRGTLSRGDALSPEGQTLVHDVHDIVETLRALVRDKNADEVLQNFVWHTRDVSLDSARKGTSDVPPVERDRARSDGEQAVRHLRTLLSLVFTNAEVRKLVGDFGVIGRDLLARGAEKVAEQARPDEEALRRVDQPAPDHTFYTEGGRKAGPNETPVSRLSYALVTAFLHMNRSRRCKSLAPTLAWPTILTAVVTPSLPPKSNKVMTSCMAIKHWEKRSRGQGSTRSRRR